MYNTLTIKKPKIYLRWSSNFLLVYYFDRYNTNQYTKYKWNHLSYKTEVDKKYTVHVYLKYIYLFKTNNKSFT